MLDVETDPYVQSSAFYALQSLGDPRSIPALTRLEKRLEDSKKKKS